MAITDRLRTKAWDVPADIPLSGRIFLSGPNGKNCVTLETFDFATYRDLAAPKSETIAKLVEPYPVVIEVSGYPCP